MVEAAPKGRSRKGAAAQERSADNVVAFDDALDETYQRIFTVLDEESTGSVTKWDLIETLRENGIRVRDKRIHETMLRLDEIADREPLDLPAFRRAVHRENVTLIERALRGELVIPDFKSFDLELAEIFEDCREEAGGQVADYIPQLARVNPEFYAMTACTIDGQMAKFGDWEETFCMQSTCKPINYAIALELHGEGKVHSHVGREPSGRGFNEITLNPQGLPHNPMINAGAIMCCSLIKPDLPLAERFGFMTEIWRAMSGDRKPGFDNAVYHSEKDTADRNFALAYFMRENGAFPDNTDLHATLDLYFQACSIEIDAERMAVMAATLANAGVCPLTGKKVFSADTVKNVLSLMFSCGMYDFSGEYAFTVGLPAKSGVSGGLMIVVPNVCGFAVWSPRLDALGNTVRGVAISKRLVERFNFHNYDSLVDHGDKIDPRTHHAVNAGDPAFLVNSAAAKGDVNELKRLVAYGVPLGVADYDGRTPLHLAVCEGHERAVRFLISRGADCSAKDRWGHTCVDDAKTNKRESILRLLEEAQSSEDAAA